MKTKMIELIAQAKSYLQDGKYQQAIESAQQVLSNYDPNSVEAKGIIEIAQSKLKEIAENKAAELKAMANKKMSGVTSPLGSLGQ